MPRLICTLMIVCWMVHQGVIGAAEEPENQAREARLQRMRTIAGRINVTMGSPGESKEMPLIRSPLLRFSDPTREFHDATLWAWGTAGRPVCLLTVEQYGDETHFELISLTDRPLTAAAGAVEWKPQSAGLALQPFPNSPKPVKEVPLRLAQMKELLAKLSAHEVRRTGERFELRLLPTPVHRYSMPAEQILDGAIFVYANGTNPELLAVLEARGERIESAEWQIGFVRSGGAEQHVLLDDVELFQIPYVRGTKPTDPYWIFKNRDLAKDE